MLVELGHYALILALLLAAAQAFFGLVGPALGRERWLAAVPSAATGQFVFLSVATGVLVHAFIEDDFSVRYGAENPTSALPMFTASRRCGARTRDRCCCGHWCS